MRHGKTGIAVKIALAVFAVFCLVTVFKLKLELDSLGQEYSELQEKIEASEDYIKKLENRLEGKFDEEYIREIAKEKLNLVLPEEIIFYNDIAG